MERTLITLFNPVQAHSAITALWPHIKAALIAGHRLVLEVKPRTRSNEQNAKLHAMLQEIASQMEWAGKRRDIETWKRLLTASWCRAIGEQVEFLPALDGHGVDIVFRRSSELTTHEMASLIDFIQAWAVDNDIQMASQEFA